jgi:hypothetical protein
MEFRIAPLILVIIAFALLGYNVYDTFINFTSIHWKQLGIGSFILLLANGAYRGHHFFTKQYKLAFWLFFFIDAAMLVALAIKYFLSLT